MVYLIAANLVMLLHYAFLAFATFGGFLLRWWPHMLWWHLPIVTWGVAIAAIGWTCPLTPLENRLRVLGGSSAYAGGFVERYLLPVLYPEHLTLAIQQGLGVIVVVVNLAAYAWAWRARRHREA